MTYLRPVRVEDQSRALSLDELKQRGNVMITAIQKSGVDAVRLSLLSEFVANRDSVTPAKLRRWRSDVRGAIEAWRHVESLCTELLNEVERTSKNRTP
mgnify:CR=1 FL=1